MYISFLERKLFPHSSPYQHSRRRYVVFAFVVSTVVLIAAELKIFKQSVKKPGKAIPAELAPWGTSR